MIKILEYDTRENEYDPFLDRDQPPENSEIFSAGDHNWVVDYYYSWQEIYEEDHPENYPWAKTSPRYGVTYLLDKNGQEIKKLDTVDTDTVVNALAELVK